jgi:hypothetical protein
MARPYNIANTTVQQVITFSSPHVHGSMNRRFIDPYIAEEFNKTLRLTGYSIFHLVVFLTVSLD